MAERDGNVSHEEGEVTEDECAITQPAPDVVDDDEECVITQPAPDVVVDDEECAKIVEDCEPEQTAPDAEQNTTHPVEGDTVGEESDATRPLEVAADDEAVRPEDLDTVKELEEDPVTESSSRQAYKRSYSDAGFSGINLCHGCGVDMGDQNGRQYCRKTYCPELENLSHSPSP
jgi:hypothetical protein